jgi:DNA (cytosine-5)-methyltransferase 1
MRNKPKLLDLFCGAGGAAMGYHRAGFKVVGVDIEPQPHYPFEFIQADVFDFLNDASDPDHCPEHRGGYCLNEFDAIHASPPCQRYSRIAPKNGDYPDLYVPIRTRLSFLTMPWVIENVIGAPYGYGFVLCGSMFNLVVRRHRNFETSWLHLMGLRCDHARQGRPITVTGHGGGVPSRHSDRGVKAEWPEYMGMPWATPKECTQAIPPTYTEYIGKELQRIVNG